MHTTCVPGAFGSQDRVLDSLEMELWMLISHHLDAGDCII